MICYGDMTFCPFYKDCATPCFRSLTPEVQKEADEWWGEGENEAPICVFSNKPGCFKDK